MPQKVQTPDLTVIPKSLTLAEQGIETSHDFANVMSATMTDVLAGRITPNISNAVCNAGSRLLKVVEMQLKYGTKGDNGGEKTLMLAPRATRKR